MGDMNRFNEYNTEFSNSYHDSKSKNKSKPSQKEKNLHNAIVTIIIAAFYMGLIVGSILVCVYSINSLIKSSTTPVTVTKVIMVDGPLDAPVLLLMFKDVRVAKMCRCEYKNFTENNFTENKCEIKYVHSNAYNYLRVLNPQAAASSQSHFLKNESMVFLFFKGPQHWKTQEVLNVECDLESSASVTLQDKPIVEYLFLPVWNTFDSYDNSEKDILIYEHLTTHPGMRFFPYGFENFVLISRSEIWELGAKDPSVRLQTETSLSLIDKSGFLNMSGSNVSKFQVEVQWKDGYVNHVSSIITATPWSAVSVVCTMLLMLEKSYGFGGRIYSSLRSKKGSSKKLSEPLEITDELLLNQFKNDSNFIVISKQHWQTVQDNLQEVKEVFQNYGVVLNKSSSHF